MRRQILSLYAQVYKHTVLPFLLRQSPQKSHQAVLKILSYLDGSQPAISILRLIRAVFFSRTKIAVGEVALDNPMIVAAGLVKGHGYTTEEEAIHAVRRGMNIIPGWHSVPALLGAVEFGSFTRFPRLGNPGTTMWRDAATRSTQNRVGLKNPGARAAALFLHQHRAQLPRIWGINIAPSPGLHSADEEEKDTLETLEIFLSHGILPSWFTLNLSCPNTEDDPGAKQTHETAVQLCSQLRDRLDSVNIPLWVKVSPGLSCQQYASLMKAFVETRVSAVIATNTLSMPSPDDPSVYAGVAGGILFEKSLEAVEFLASAAHIYTNAPDLIACGGILNSSAYAAMRARGAKACQYWSSLIYGGPLVAAAIIEDVL